LALKSLILACREGLGVRRCFSVDKIERKWLQ